MTQKSQPSSWVLYLPGTAAWQWAPCRKPAHDQDKKWVRKIPKDDQQSKGWGIQTSVDSLDYI